MEILIQYLDDLDDLIGMLGLVAERIRSLFLALLSCVSLIAVAVPGVWLALVRGRIPADVAVGGRSRKRVVATSQRRGGRWRGENRVEVV